MPYKKYICHCLLFCFHQKKSAAEKYTELFVRRMFGKNVIAIKTCALV